MAEGILRNSASDLFEIFSAGSNPKGEVHPSAIEALKEINIDISTGSKNFTAYTMDLTKKYIEINSDYRS